MTTDFDSTEDGISLINELRDYIKANNSPINKLYMLGSNSGLPYDYSLISSYFPASIDKWFDYKLIINYNKFINAVGKTCKPSRNNRVQTIFLQYYKNIRNISSQIRSFAIEYDKKRQTLIEKGSIWVKSIPIIKCEVEQLSLSEFISLHKYCSDYNISQTNQIYNQNN